MRLRKDILELLQPIANEFELISPDALFSQAVYLRKMVQRDGKILWGVFQSGQTVCLTSDGMDFVYQEMPSNRNEEFLKNHRFDCAEDAINAFKFHLENGTTSGHVRDQWKERFPKSL